MHIKDQRAGVTWQQDSTSAADVITLCTHSHAVSGTPVCRPSRNAFVFDLLHVPSGRPSGRARPRRRPIPSRIQLISGLRRAANSGDFLGALVPPGSGDQLVELCRHAARRTDGRTALIKVVSGRCRGVGRLGHSPFHWCIFIRPTAQRTHRLANNDLMDPIKATNTVTDHCIAPATAAAAAAAEPVERILSLFQ